MVMYQCTPMTVKFGMIEEVMGLLLRAKFDPDRQRGVGSGATRNFKILSKCSISVLQGQ